jgi:hypothetical protein
VSALQITVVVLFLLVEGLELHEPVIASIRRRFG